MQANLIAKMQCVRATGNNIFVVVADNDVLLYFDAGNKETTTPHTIQKRKGEGMMPPASKKTKPAYKKIPGKTPIPVAITKVTEVAIDIPAPPSGGRRSGSSSPAPSESSSRRSSLDSKSTSPASVGGACLYCKSCNLLLRNDGVLEKHISVCQPSRKKVKIGCKACKKDFKTVLAAKSHRGVCKKGAVLPQVEPPENFCKQCNKTYDDIDTHRNYNLHVNARGKFECKFCLEEFEEAKFVITHRRKYCTKAKEVTEVNIKLAEAKKKYCQQCDRTFSTVGACKSHIMAGRHKNKHGQYMCQHCSKGFQFEKALVSHELIEHPEEADAPMVTDAMVEFQHGYGLDKEPEVVEIDSGMCICCIFKVRVNCDVIKQNKSELAIDFER